MLRNGNIIPYHKRYKSSQGAFAPFARYVWCLMESFCFINGFPAILPSRESQSMCPKYCNFSQKSSFQTICLPHLQRVQIAHQLQIQLAMPSWDIWNFNCASKKKYMEKIDWCKDFLPKGMEDLIFFTPRLQGAYALQGQRCLVPWADLLNHGASQEASDYPAKFWVLDGRKMM